MGISAIIKKVQNSFGYVLILYLCSSTSSESLLLFINNINKKVFIKPREGDREQQSGHQPGYFPIVCLTCHATFLEGGVATTRWPALLNQKVVWLHQSCIGLLVAFVFPKKKRERERERERLSYFK